MPFLAPKYSPVDSEGLLRRFAKYTLLPVHVRRHHFDAWQTHNLPLRLSKAPYTLFHVTF